MTGGGGWKAIAWFAFSLTSPSSPYPEFVLRERLDSQLGIELVETGAVFQEEEVRLVYDELTTGMLQRFGRLESLRSLEKRPRRGPVQGQFGNYSLSRRQIRIQEGVPNFKMVFLHEYFHAVAAQYPALFEEFCLKAGWIIDLKGGELVYDFQYRDPWTGEGAELRITPFEIAQNPEKVMAWLDLPSFPSDYSKLGPHEMFAETGSAAVYGLENDLSSSYRIERFATTELAAWWKRILLEGRAP